MARTVAILYREYLKNYVVNERGNLIYDPKECTVFDHFEGALKYITQNYGKKPTNLVLDQFCRENHSDNLENKLKKTKITKLEPRLKRLKH